jgi:hypothetical protein
MVAVVVDEYYFVEHVWLIGLAVENDLDYSKEKKNFYSN